MPQYVRPTYDGTRATPGVRYLYRATAPEKMDAHQRSTRVVLKRIRKQLPAPFAPFDDAASDIQEKQTAVAELEAANEQAPSLHELKVAERLGKIDSAQDAHEKHQANTEALKDARAELEVAEVYFRELCTDSDALDTLRKAIATRYDEQAVEVMERYADAVEAIEQSISAVEAIDERPRKELTPSARAAISNPAEKMLAPLTDALDIARTGLKRYENQAPRGVAEVPA